MKKKYIYPFFFIVIIVVTSCGEEILPPLKCNDYQLKFSPFNSGDTIESIYFSLETVGAEEIVFFDTMFINPPDTFEYNSNFCGNFKYTIEVNHKKSVFGGSIGLIVGKDFTYTHVEKVNGYKKVEGYYFFN